MPRQADPTLPGRIVEAAYALWRKDGDGAVTLRDVARRAGTTTPSVYAHFADRAAILRAVRMLAHDRFVAALAKSNQRDRRLRAHAGLRRRASARLRAAVRLRLPRSRRARGAGGAVRDLRGLHPPSRRARPRRAADGVRHPQPGPWCRDVPAGAGQAGPVVAGIARGLPRCLRPVARAAPALRGVPRRAVDGQPGGS